MKLLFWIISSFLATTLTVVNSHGVSRPYEVFHLPPRNGPAAGPGNRAAGPVCATNGKNYVLFEDEGLLNEYNYAKLRPGEYPFRKTTAVHCFNACKHIKCTSTYAPLCVSAQNSRLRETMSNECELDRRFCLTQTPLIILYDGPCISSCPNGCSKNYRPVCAQSNSKKLTFANICKLKCFVHETKQKWTVIHEGPCNTHTYVYEKKKPKETSAIGRANIYGQPYRQPPRGVYEEAPSKVIPHAASEYGPRHFPSSSSLSQKYSSDELLTLLLDALKSSSGKESPSMESGASKKSGKITTTTHAPTTIEAETPFDRRIENVLKRYLDSIERSSDIIIRNVTEMLNNTFLKAEAKNLVEPVLDWIKKGLPIGNIIPENTGTKSGSTVPSTPPSVESNFDRRIENLLKPYLNSIERSSDIIIRNVTEMINNTSLKAEKLVEPVLDWIKKGIPIGNIIPENTGTKSGSIVPSTPTSVESNNCCPLIDGIITTSKRIEDLLKPYLDSIEKSSDIIIRNVTEMLNNTSLKAEAKKLVEPVLDWIKKGLPIGNIKPENTGTMNGSIVPSTPTSVEPHNCCRLIPLIVDIVRKGLKFNNNSTDSGEWFDDDDTEYPEDSLETDSEVDATTTTTTLPLSSTTASLGTLIGRLVPSIRRIIFSPNTNN